MKSEIICIGDELLIGQVINTNAAWLGEQLNAAGVEVVKVTVVGDSGDSITDALSSAARHADLILITGGLGPTRDDITKELLCRYFGCELVFNNEVFETIEAFFRSRGREVTALNRSQAEVPSCCRPLVNYNGTAPGMWFEQHGRIFVSMPGVPYEMHQIMEDYVLPEIRKMGNGEYILHKTVLTQGIGESFLTVMIKDWEQQLPGFIKLAYLPQPGIVRLRLTAAGNDHDLLTAELEHQVQLLRDIIPDLIFGYDQDTLQEIILKKLRENHATLATAESCTGGYLSHLITTVPGSSACYRGSVIAYDNDIKKTALLVGADVLEEHGAVSEPVVRLMAENIRTSFGTDYALSTSGIAGPDGGTAEKPVGMVWIGLAGPHGTAAEVFYFGEHRQRNIHKTAVTALNMIRKQLLRDFEGSTL